jgi:hypothetical protein
MGRFAKVDFKEFKDFQKKLKQLEKAELEEFARDCSKELAARLLAKVIKRTPVGNPDNWKHTYRVVERVKSGKNKGQERLSKNKFITSFKTSSGKQVSFESTSNYQGGTLRRGWTAGTNQNARSYAYNLPVSKSGNNYHIEIINPVEYGIYVEYGHRTRNHKSWVPGQFFLTVSEQELESQAVQILNKKLMKLLGEVFDDK